MKTTKSKSINLLKNRATKVVLVVIVLTIIVSIGELFKKESLAGSVTNFLLLKELRK